VERNLLLAKELLSHDDKIALICMGKDEFRQKCRDAVVRLRESRVGALAMSSGAAIVDSACSSSKGRTVHGPETTSHVVDSRYVKTGTLRSWRPVGAKANTEGECDICDISSPAEAAGRGAVTGTATGAASGVLGRTGVVQMRIKKRTNPKSGRVDYHGFILNPDDVKKGLFFRMHDVVQDSIPAGIHGGAFLKEHDVVTYKNVDADGARRGATEIRFVRRPSAGVAAGTGAAAEFSDTEDLRTQTDLTNSDTAKEKSELALVDERKPGKNATISGEDEVDREIFDDRDIAAVAEDIITADIITAEDIAEIVRKISRTNIMQKYSQEDRHRVKRRKTLAKEMLSFDTKSDLIGMDANKFHRKCLAAIVRLRGSRASNATAVAEKSEKSELATVDEHFTISSWGPSSGFNSSGRVYPLEVGLVQTNDCYMTTSGSHEFLSEIVDSQNSEIVFKQENLGSLPKSAVFAGCGKEEEEENEGPDLVPDAVIHGSGSRVVGIGSSENSKNSLGAKKGLLKCTKKLNREKQNSNRLRSSIRSSCSYDRDTLLKYKTHARHVVRDEDESGNESGKNDAQKNPLAHLQLRAVYFRSSGKKSLNASTRFRRRDLRMVEEEAAKPRVALSSAGSSPATEATTGVSTVSAATSTENEIFGVVQMRIQERINPKNGFVDYHGFIRNPDDVKKGFFFRIHDVVQDSIPVDHGGALGTLKEHDIVTYKKVEGATARRDVADGARCRATEIRFVRRPTAGIAAGTGVATAAAAVVSDTENLQPADVTKPADTAKKESESARVDEHPKDVSISYKDITQEEVVDQPENHEEFLTTVQKLNHESTEIVGGITGGGANTTTSSEVTAKDIEIIIKKLQETRVVTKRQIEILSEFLYGGTSQQNDEMALHTLVEEMLKNNTVSNLTMYMDRQKLRKESFIAFSRIMGGMSECLEEGSSWQNLKDDGFPTGPGIFREEQEGENWGAMLPGENLFERIECFEHGKFRYKHCMKLGDDGNWRCLCGHECRDRYVEYKAKRVASFRRQLRESVPSGQEELYEDGTSYEEPQQQPGNFFLNGSWGEFNDLWFPWLPFEHDLGAQYEDHIDHIPVFEQYCEYSQPLDHENVGPGQEYYVDPGDPGKECWYDGSEQQYKNFQQQFNTGCDEQQLLTPGRGFMMSNSSSVLMNRVLEQYARNVELQQEFFEQQQQEFFEQQQERQLLMPGSAEEQAELHEHCGTTT